MKKQKLNKLLFCLTRLAPLLLLLILVLPGCEKKASEEARPPSLKSDDKKAIQINPSGTRLAAIPEDYDEWGSVSFSADGRQVAYIARKGGKQFVVVGDKPDQPYDAVWKDTMALSRDGQRIAYSGKRGDKWFLVLDGKERQPYENTGSIIFSSDGRLVSCEVKDKGSWFILIYDGEKEVYRSQAYRDSFRPPVFSPDSRMLVYELGERGKKRIVFFLDVTKRKMIKKRLYDEIGIAGKFSFSSDFSRIVYEAAKEGGFSLVFQDFVLDEEKTIKFPDMMQGTIVLSPNGKKIAYLAAKEGNQFLAVSPWESPQQGNEKGPYEAINLPVFGPDFATVAFQALKEGKWRSVVGNKEGLARYDGVDAPVFSSDGARIAYPAMKSGRFLMIVSPTGKPDVVREGPVYDMAVTPVFSPDSRRIAYRARKGPIENAKRFIVIADAETGKVIKQGPVGDEVWPPVWSADGKAVAYGARKGRELWWRVEEVK